MSDEITWRKDVPPKAAASGVRVGRDASGTQIVDDRGVRWKRDPAGRWRAVDMLPTSNAAGWGDP